MYKKTNQKTIQKVKFLAVLKNGNITRKSDSILTHVFINEFRFV